MSKPVAAKGWSDCGIKRFNELFDQVKADRKNFPNFVKDWVKWKQAEKLVRSDYKCRGCAQLKAWSELFESDNDDDNVVTGSINLETAVDENDHEDDEDD